MAGKQAVDAPIPAERRLRQLDADASKGVTHETVARLIETNTGLMIALIILVVSVGGLVEIVPLFFQRSTTEPVAGLEAVHARCSSRAATSTSAKAATTATRR